MRRCALRIHEIHRMCVYMRWVLKHFNRFLFMRWREAILNNTCTAFECVCFQWQIGSLDRWHVYIIHFSNDHKQNNHRSHIRSGRAIGPQAYDDGNDDKNWLNPCVTAIKLAEGLIANHREMGSIRRNVARVFFLLVFGNLQCSWCFTLHSKAHNWPRFCCCCQYGLLYLL